MATLSLTGGSFTASGGYAVTAFAEGDDVGRLLGEGCAYFDSNGKPIAETSVQHLGENAGRHRQVRDVHRRGRRHT